MCADIVGVAKRSQMMSGIRSTGTALERAVRSFLHRNGFRFGKSAGLPGRPDVVLPKFGAVVFVHGCYWHRHKGCRFAYTPKSNIASWNAKFDKNIARDRRVARELRSLGWRVLTIWGCQLSEARLHSLARRIVRDT